MNEKIIVLNSEYIISAVSKAQYPEEKLPEIVFVGRSNVGKSSLINSLTNRRNLARTSQTPGKTQTINFFKVALKFIDEKNPSGEYERRNFYLVDLPGYGYAKTGKANRKTWAKFIDEYLSTSEQIKFVCHLIDSRHPPMDSDKKMLENLLEKNLPVLAIATKFDKLKKNDRQKNISIIKKTLGIAELPVLPYSSEKNEGRSELLDVIVTSLIE